MLLRRIFPIGLAVLVALSLLSGGMVHALVPHQDVHDDGSPDVSWALLHSALHSEEKKTFAILGALLALFSLGVRILPILLLLPAFAFAVPGRNYCSLSLEDALRRGILSYRKFR